MKIAQLEGAAKKAKQEANVAEAKSKEAARRAKAAKEKARQTKWEHKQAKKAAKQAKKAAKKALKKAAEAEGLLQEAGKVEVQAEKKSSAKGNGQPGQVRPSVKVKRATPKQAMIKPQAGSEKGPVQSEPIGGDVDVSSEVPAQAPADSAS